MPGSEKGEKFLRELPNGLTILGEKNLEHKSSALGYFVKTGARDEFPAESGVSHFLEHMVFKGTEKRGALDITYALGDLGAQANAYTSEENTVFYGAILPEYFSGMLELLTDMMMPALDPEEFAMEKKVILEEIALYQDRPVFYLFEKALGDYFSGHPAGNSVLGTTDSIKALSRDQMAEYFERRYSPDNMILVAAGNFDEERLFAEAEKLTSDWKSKNPQRDTPPFTAEQPRKAEYQKAALQQAHVLLMANACSSQDSRRYPFHLLSMILGDSSGSELYWRLVDRGLADSAGTEHEARDGVGCFLAYASTAPERLAEVSAILKDTLLKPLEFDDAALERAKVKTAARLVLGGELPLGRLMSLGSEWLSRREIHDLSAEVEKIKAVTRKDITEALEAYPLTTWSEYTLVPGSCKRGAERMSN